jgi:hypothetical protein
MQLFARDLRTLGTSVATYFEFRRPRGIALCFNEIVKRANTPFVLSIRWPDSTAEDRLAEVSGKLNYNTVLQIREGEAVLYVVSKPGTQVSKPWCHLSIKFVDSDNPKEGEA